MKFTRLKKGDYLYYCQLRSIDNCCVSHFKRVLIVDVVYTYENLFKLFTLEDGSTFTINRLWHGVTGYYLEDTDEVVLTEPYINGFQVEEGADSIRKYYLLGGTTTWYQREKEKVGMTIGIGSQVVNYDDLGFEYYKKQVTEAINNILLTEYGDVDVYPSVMEEVLEDGYVAGVIVSVFVNEYREHIPAMIQCKRKRKAILSVVENGEISKEVLFKLLCGRQVDSELESELYKNYGESFLKHFYTLVIGEDVYDAIEKYLGRKLLNSLEVL